MMCLNCDGEGITQDMYMDWSDCTVCDGTKQVPYTRKQFIEMIKSVYPDKQVIEVLLNNMSLPQVMERIAVGSFLQEIRLEDEQADILRHQFAHHEKYGRMDLDE